MKEFSCKIKCGICCYRESPVIPLSPEEAGSGKYKTSEIKEISSVRPHKDMNLTASVAKTYMDEYIGAYKRSFKRKGYSDKVMKTAFKFIPRLREAKEVCFYYDPGKGKCNIYDQRPGVCRRYSCYRAGTEEAILHDQKIL